MEYVVYSRCMELSTICLIIKKEEEKKNNHTQHKIKTNNNDQYDYKEEDTGVDYSLTSVMM